MRRFFLFILIFNTTACLAQIRLKKTLTVKILVLDSINNMPILGANVFVFDNTNHPISRGSTINNGEYIFVGDSINSFSIQVSHIGYNTHKSVVSGNCTFKTITLTRSSKILTEVSIYNKRDLIKDMGDKLVYNVEKDIDVGGTVIDLLRKIPLVSIDLNGTPSIKSNSSIKILINGRPSTIQNPGVIFKTLPAAIISKIEIITSPSAKYEAEGSGGIINIITKNSLLLGTVGTLDGGLGTKASHLAGSLYSTKNKFALNLSYGAYWFYDKTNEYTNLSNNILGSQKDIFIQNSTGSYNGNRSFLQLNLDYKLSDKDLFGIDVMYSGNHKITITSSESFFFSTNTPVNRNNKLPDVDYLSTVSTYFEHKFNNIKKQLNARFTFGLYNDNTQYNYFQYLTNNYNFNQFFKNITGNKEFDGQIDYLTPVFISKNILEIGARAISRKMNSYYTTITKKDTEIQKETASVGYLNYNQKILAGYLLDSYKLNNLLSARAGLRYEIVSNSLALSSTQLNSNYDNLFPSAGITWTISNIRSLSVNYNYRIKRPSIQYLNPAIDASEIVVQYSGNPFLRPEYTNNIEVSFSSYIGNNYIKVTPYYASTKNYINTISTYSNQIMLTTYSNVGTRRTLGTNIWSTIDLIKNLIFNNSIDLNYSKIFPYNVNFSSNTGFNLSENFNLTYKIKNKYSIQYFGNFYTPRVELQGTHSSYSFSNFAIKDDFSNKKYSIALSIDNPFRNSFNYQIKNTITTELNYIDETRYFDRGFRIIFSYNFGKGENTKVINRKKDENDLKNIDEKIK